MKETVGMNLTTEQPSVSHIYNKIHKTIQIKTCTKHDPTAPGNVRHAGALIRNAILVTHKFMDVRSTRLYRDDTGKKIWEKHKICRGKALGFQKEHNKPVGPLVCAPISCW